MCAFLFLLGFVFPRKVSFFFFFFPFDSLSYLVNLDMKEFELLSRASASVFAGPSSTSLPPLLSSETNEFLNTLNKPTQNYPAFLRKLESEALGHKNNDNDNESFPSLALCPPPLLEPFSRTLQMLDSFPSLSFSPTYPLPSSSLCFFFFFLFFSFFFNLNLVSIFFQETIISLELGMLPILILFYLSTRFKSNLGFGIPFYFITSSNGSSLFLFLFLCPLSF